VPAGLQGSPAYEPTEPHITVRTSLVVVVVMRRVVDGARGVDVDPEIAHETPDE
jgi:hypothetical protein